MTQERSITATASSVPTIEGAGVHLRRAFGFHAPQRHDPFLLFDDFRATSPKFFAKGFPWHPHRGIETITYVLQGDVEHGDSLGNSGVISGGEVQWMTAGSGIIHQEMPQGDASGALQGFQLWLNLPAKEKMCPPRYRGISAGEIPEMTGHDGVKIKVICGKIGSVSGPVTDITTDPEYLDITIPAGVSFTHPTKAGYSALAYVIDGSGRFSGESAEEYGNTTLVTYSLVGDEVKITAGRNGVRLLFFSGKPLGEPIAWQGPIVMNTEEELAQAFHEYRNYTFLSHSVEAS